MSNLTNINNLSQLNSYIEGTEALKLFENSKSWSNAFKVIEGGASKLTEVAKGVETEVTSIADAYLTVGKEIATETTNGIKSLPTVETIVTNATTGTAVTTELAVGSKAVGVATGTSLLSVLGSIFAGLGLGVYSYETSPEFWVNASNYIFGTDIDVDSVQPLIRTKIRNIIARRNNKPVNFIPAEYVKKAYDFIANHTTRYVEKAGFDDITFNPNTGLATSPNRLNRPIVSELNYVSLDMMQTFMQDIVNRVAELGIIVRPIDLSPLYERMQDAFDLSNPKYVRMRFDVDLGRWENDFAVTEPSGVTVNRFYIEIYKQDINAVNVYGKTYGDNYSCLLLDENGSTYPLGAPDISAGVIIDSTSWSGVRTNYYLTENGHAYDAGSRWHPGERYNDAYTWIGNCFEGLDINTNYGDLTLETLRGTHAYFFTSNFQPDIKPEVDYDELLDGAVFVVGQKTPNPAKTPEELFYEWLHEHGMDVAQPNAEGVNTITTYVPAEVPMEVQDPSRIAEHGINVADDPLSPTLPQPKVHEGVLPDTITPEALDDAIKSAIDDYDKSKVTPESAPDPLPDTAENPKYPNEPTQTPDGDTGIIPPAPTMVGGNATGLISLYNPTKAQLSDFAGWLWSSNFIDNFIKIFANPMDAIIGLHILYATPITGGNSNIQVGYLDSGVSSKVITQQYSDIDCGTVTIPEYFGNATDYDPYTQIHCYLPFIGIVPLKTNDVMGKTLNITYGIDALTGTCLASLTTYKNGSKITTYTFTGNCAVQLPITGGSYSNMITGLAGFIAGGIGAIATANPLMALGAGASFLQSSVNVQHSGSIGSNAGAMGIRKPYLIISRKFSYDADSYNEFYGYPSNETVVLGGCRGYTKIKEVHVDSIGVATETEKQKIETLLKSGVIIN